MFGPTLLADPRIILVVHDWWLNAKEGDKESAQRLGNVLKALTPGQGNLRKLDAEEAIQLKRQSTKASKERLIARTKKEVVSLCESLNREWERHPQHSKENGENREQAKQALATALIQKDLASKDAARREAARQLQGK